MYAQRNPLPEQGVQKGVVFRWPRPQQPKGGVGKANCQRQGSAWGYVCLATGDQIEKSEMTVILGIDSKLPLKRGLSERDREIAFKVVRPTIAITKKRPRRSRHLRDGNRKHPINPRET